ncbi:MAG: hypothetical protein O2865_02230 [Planctomycetota bacterium]|nr:hypothetical protein [Planctomycetota bacterium]MDA0931872.1 hypothetical protein [Planctomycetota bacterium]MDA1223488.1 hypothetical protein [Planctomycetota bacterium]
MSIVLSPRPAALVLAAAFAAIPVSVRAQEAGEASGTGPGPQEPVVVEAAAPKAPEAYGRVERADTELRCFPTSYSPTYDEKLGEGDVVVPTGEERNGYRAVRLPLGVRGFVHGRFAKLGEDGMVRTEGARVAFRYRPTSAEAPVRLVDEGTAFVLVGIEGDWFEVRFPEQHAWVASDAVVVFPAAEAVPTLIAAWDGAVSRQKSEAEAALAARQAEQAEAARLEALDAEVRALSARFRSEYAKPEADQDVAPVRDACVALIGQAPEGSKVRTDAERLLAEVERQAQAIAMLQIVEAEPPKPEADPLPPRVEVDPLGEFVTGWVRVRGGVFTPRVAQLEKGGQVLLEIECTTGRYDLSLFDGMEVGVRGPANRPASDSLRRLDVQRLEVLSLPRR